MTRGRATMQQQARQLLSPKLHIGESRLDAKINGTAADSIHCWKTYEGYARQAARFGDWAREQGYGSKLADMKDHVPEYMQHVKDSGASAYTQKTTLSALRKVYGQNTAADFKTDSRCRADITRSRGEVAQDKHYSEKNHAEAVETYRSIGLRRSEIENLHGGCCEQRSDGNWYITGLREATGNHTKGGRDRDVRILGEHAGEIAAKINGTPSDQLVYGRQPKVADIHHYRADYARADYEQRVMEKYGTAGLSADGSGIPAADRYYCRGDMLGQVFSRSCMKEVSEDMGHSRESVIASNYLYRTW